MVEMLSLERTNAGRGYVDEAVALSAGQAAQLALDELFLRAQAHWGTLAKAAHVLQTNMADHRRVIFGHQKWHVADHDIERSLVINQLNGYDELDAILREKDNSDFVNALHGAWRDMSEGYGDDWAEEDHTVLDRRVSSPSLCRADPQWARKLRTGCINTFVRDRIRCGIWVSPADEIEHLASGKDIYAPLRTIAQSAGHPFGHEIGLDDYSWLALFEHPHRAWINLDLPANGLGPMLPTPALAKDLETAFGIRLQLVLRRVFDEIVGMYEGDFGDQAEEACKRVTVDDLLDLLHNQNVWHEHGTDVEDEGEDGEEVEWSDGEELLEVYDNDPDVGYTSLASSLAKIGSQEPTGRATPRIEVVVEDQPANDYGIEELPASSPSAADDGRAGSEAGSDARHDARTQAATTRNEDGMDSEITMNVRSIAEDEVNFTTLGKRKEAPEADTCTRKENNAPATKVGLPPRYTAITANA
jgi:hypothetical protein